jgi:hypothetical protein
VKHESDVVIGREFFHEGTDESVDAGSEHSVGNRQKLKRSCGHAWKSQWRSIWAENLSIKGARDDVNLIPLDAGCGERLAMKLARHPDLVKSVAAFGPAVGNSIGAKRGAANAAATVEVEIPV